MTKNNYPPIPSREEFHRYASNLLYEEDFCTDCYGREGFQVNRVSAALKWTINNSTAPKYMRAYEND